MRYNKAPFPYYGGKGKRAKKVWEAFGKLDRYIEPFFGSGAVLLRNPWPPKKEIVCDLSPNVSNFWRSIQNDAKEVAKWADYPSNHMDLHARHIWLTQWAKDNHDRLWNDPEFYDAKAAGWWAWGMSTWIGGGFAEGGAVDGIPMVRGHFDTSAQGVHCEGVHDKVPNVGPENTMRGVHNLTDLRPHVMASCNGGRGVHSIPVDEFHPLDGTRLQPWFVWLCGRLKSVEPLHRPWDKAVSDVMTMKAANGKKKVGIFLDPPYKTEHRSHHIYRSDIDGSSDDVATDCYEWAVDKAQERPELKIAYCCRRGDFPLPDGWTDEVKDFSGPNDKDRRAKHKEQIMFSPACFEGSTSQREMF